MKILSRSDWLVGMSSGIALLPIDGVGSVMYVASIDSMSVVWTAPFPGKAGCMDNILRMDQPGTQQADFLHSSCSSFLVLSEFFGPR